jgi:hypothetical protein
MVQTDETGKFVYVMVKEGDKQIARKRQVTIQGEPYKGQVAIAAGLSEWRNAHHRRVPNSV